MTAVDCYLLTDCFNSAVAKPPFDAPVLFDVQSESSTIKQGKDGSYKLVLEGVEKVHWETDDTEAEEAYYSAKKYAKNYGNYYGKDAEVNAYETFTLADGSKKKCKFTITDVKYNQKSNKLVYDIEPANKKQADKITGIESETQTESAVYSTERTRWRPDWMPNGFKRDLTGADLTDADLRDADLRGAVLTDAVLTDADLRDADLTRAVLTDAVLTNPSKLGRAADLRDAELVRADLTGVKAKFVNLRDADLTRAVLTDADLRRADLIDAVLTDADLTRAKIYFSLMNRADLTDAILTGADLRDAAMFSTVLTDAVLTGADLRKARLLGAYLSYADLRDADLTGAKWFGEVRDADLAIWGNTTCPDGSMNIGYSPCM